MKIGIVGGTGGMGEGFALRWCNKHEVVIGSRDAQRAKEVAKTYSLAALNAQGTIGGSISGDENIALAKDVEVLILSIPYESIDDTCTKLATIAREDCVVISPIVPMTRTEAGFTFIPLETSTKPAAEKVSDKMPPRSRIVSAFHTISEIKLKNIPSPVDSDVFICGDDQQSVSKVSVLATEISGLRPIYLGPLSLSYQAEILTPMLLNAAKRNKLKHPGLKLV